MIRARNLLKSSYTLIFQYPSLLIYGFLAFIPFLMPYVLSVLFIAAGFVLSPVAATVVALPLFIVAVFGIVLLPLYTMVVNLGFVVYVQSILRHNNRGLFASLSQAWSLLWNAPWLIIFFIAALWVNSLPLLMLVFMIATLYVKQLVYDQHFGLIECLSLSWQYVQKSYLVLIKLFVLLVGIIILLPAIMALALPFLLIPVLGLLIVASLGLLWIITACSSTTVAAIAVNKLYLILKQGEQ